MITLNIFDAYAPSVRQEVEVHATTASGVVVVFTIENYIIDQIAEEKDLNFQELVDTEGIVRAVKEILA
jgi:predicted DNA-binding ribbon-helix-helix protein